MALNSGLHLGWYPLNLLVSQLIYCVTLETLLDMYEIYNCNAFVICRHVQYQDFLLMATELDKTVQIVHTLCVKFSRVDPLYQPEMNVSF